MLKKHSLTVLLFILSLSFSAFSQNISKPTLTPTEPTAAQKQLINEGAKLHDQKLYDEAIKNYDKVLQENPTCVMAIYEKALSLYYKKDFKQMFDVAFEGAKYKSNEIPLFYGLIANAYDDQGNHQKAVELYKEGIKILGSDTEFKPYLATLYYNLAITNFRQKQFAESKENTKKAISANSNYSSPHYLLAQLFNGTGYKIPSLLAAARVVSLEFNTNRAGNSAMLIKQIVQGNVKKSDNGNLTIFMNPDSPKDEGDFTSIELLLGLTEAGKTETNKNKDEIDVFADQLDTIFAFVASDKALSNTFIGKNYVPFVTGLKAKGYIKPFAGLILHYSGNKNATAYLQKNEAQLNEFLNWAKSV